MAEHLPTSAEGKETCGSIEGLSPLISSSSDPLTKELQCSICLDVFTDPVTTPCGHNFCKSCLNECWNDSQTCSCPYCKETFRQRPDLKSNTTLKENAEHYKLKRSENKSEVVCDVCEGSKEKALKSCLVCRVSFCETHLETHLRVAALKKHTQMDPVSNLEDYICQKHDRPLELFCRDDQTCVCSLCPETEHKYHNTVPIEEEGEEKKAELSNTQKDVQQIIQDKEKKIEDVKHSVEERKKNLEKEKVARVDLFTDLIHSIEKSKTELLEKMEEQHKEAVKQGKELIEELEQEINELKKTNTELEQLSHTEDHLHLLQMYPSLRKPTNTKNCPEISVKTHDSLQTLMRTCSQLKKTIEDKHSQTELKWMQQYAVDVTLDPDTAHCKLILSHGGKQVRCEEIRQNLLGKSWRYDKCVSVLGKEGFSSGRFYFAVQVEGKTDWDLGVAREYVARKGKITLNPSSGFWTVCLRNGNEYKACTDPYVLLSLKVNPQQVGVFVDYEQGLVSFYDVESSSHIYSYTGQFFSDKLYPYFSPHLNKGGQNSAPLIITPVNNIK